MQIGDCIAPIGLSLAKAMTVRLQADDINWDVIVANMPITESEGDLERIQ